MVSSSAKSTRMTSRAEAIVLGDGKYFTGKPCVRGHVAERYVAGWACISCVSEDRAEYYKRVVAPRRSLRIAIAVCEICERPAHGATLCQIHLEKMRVRSRRARTERGDEIRQSDRDRYHGNTKRRAEVIRMATLRMHERRARRRGDIHQCSTDIEYRLFIAQLFTCNSPTCNANLTCPTVTPHLDHIIPLSAAKRFYLGFPLHDDANLQLLCAHCNLTKGSKMPDEWLGWGWSLPAALTELRVIQP